MEMLEECQHSQLKIAALAKVKGKTVADKNVIENGYGTDPREVRVSAAGKFAVCMKRDLLLYSTQGSGEVRVKAEPTAKLRTVKIWSPCSVLCSMETSVKTEYNDVLFTNTFENADVHYIHTSVFCKAPYTR